MSTKENEYRPHEKPNTASLASKQREGGHPSLPRVRGKNDLRAGGKVRGDRTYVTIRVGRGEHELKA